MSNNNNSNNSNNNSNSNNSNNNNSLWNIAFALAHQLIIILVRIWCNALYVKDGFI